MAKSPFSFKILPLLFEFGKRKESKSKFWSDVFFFGLGRFSIYRVVGLLKSFFDKRPLNVGQHVDINLKLIDMAFGD